MSNVIYVLVQVESCSLANKTLVVFYLQPSTKINLIGCDIIVNYPSCLA
jgi:hypothetical protein